jgi:hypothetical protein
MIVSTVARISVSSSSHARGQIQGIVEQDGVDSNNSC